MNSGVGGTQPLDGGGGSRIVAVRAGVTGAAHVGHGTVRASSTTGSAVQSVCARNR